MFNYTIFKKNNPVYEIKKLDDFLKTEIMDSECKETIIKFLELENFKNGEYEGNVYVIHKINVTDVELIDITMEDALRNSSGYSRCFMNVDELLYMIKQYEID